MGLDRIETERLILRRWQHSDRAPFAAMNADPEVMRYFPAPMTAEASEAMVDRLEADFDRYGYGLYAMERRDEFIGFTGLAPLPFSDDIEIGWRLARPFWGRGYATEAARAVLTCAFTTLGLGRVVSITSVLNQPSQAVMRRLGMRRAADFDHPSLPAGHPLRPHVLYEAEPEWWPAAVG